MDLNTQFFTDVDGSAYVLFHELGIAVPVFKRQPRAARKTEVTESPSVEMVGQRPKRVKGPAAVNVPVQGILGKTE